MDNHISSRALLHRRDVIKNNPRFGEAITEHYRINDAIYKKQPLFYKTMLQESRFNIILSMCCFVFGNQAESVSEIKALCTRYNIASPNSVIAIITILKTTGRIKTWRCTEDRRKTKIAPTEKGLDELKRYMSGAFTPVSILFPTFNINANLLDNDILRHNFFRRAAEYLFRGLTFRKVLPEVGLFIDKDGGRMIMLYLYLQAIKNKTAHGAIIAYSASTLAKEFSFRVFMLNGLSNRRRRQVILKIAAMAGCQFTRPLSSWSKIMPDYILRMSHITSTWYQKNDAMLST